jgi:hypothetical protein
MREASRLVIGIGFDVKLAAKPSAVAPDTMARPKRKKIHKKASLDFLRTCLGYSSNPA